MILRILTAGILILAGTINIVNANEIMGWIIWGTPTVIGGWLLMGIIEKKVGIRQRYHKTPGEKI